MTLKVIAYAHNGHTDKFGIPRQSRDESPILTRIVFEPEYRIAEALRGIEGYSHLWLIWGFGENRAQNTDRFTDRAQTDHDWSPTVRPPRLGGNKRMGVFATRSPFRPNPIGLSSVHLIGVRLNEELRITNYDLGDAIDFDAMPHEHGRMELIVSGADVLDGTPIYDIKPYLSFSDSHEDALNGFAEETKDHQLEVVWPKDSIEKVAGEYCNGLGLPLHTKREISYIIAQDPRPGYQDDPQREYKMDYAGYSVSFTVEGGKAVVRGMEKLRIDN